VFEADFVGFVGRYTINALASTFSDVSVKKEAADRVLLPAVVTSAPHLRIF
jgi:hypothetical protein